MTWYGMSAAKEQKKVPFGSLDTLKSEASFLQHMHSQNTIDGKTIPIWAILYHHCSVFPASTSRFAYRSYKRWLLINLHYFRW